MAIPVQCPNCNARINAPEATAGHKVRCPKCDARMAIPARATSTADFDVVDESPASKSAPSLKSSTSLKRPVKAEAIAEEEAKEERPQKHTADKETNDEQPQKKEKSKEKKGKKEKNKNKDRNKEEKPSTGRSKQFMIGGGIAAALLLAGVVFAVSQSGSREPAKVTPTPTPEPVATRPQPPANWVLFRPSTGGFQVFFPNTPHTATHGLSGVMTKPVILSYHAERDEPMIRCQVQMIHFPTGQSAAEREAFLAKQLDPKNDPNRIGNGLKELSRGPTTLAGKPGTEVVVELDLAELLKDAPPERKADEKGRPLPAKNIAVARGIVTENRGYIVTILTANARSPEEKTYFESFELAPETPSGLKGSPTR